MAKKIEYPVIKKALWDGWRVFVPVFLATMGVALQSGIDLENWQTWLKSALIAAVAAGVRAVFKWARETYSKGDYQSLLYKVPV